MVDTPLQSELSLIDLSPLPRAGVKGKDLSLWIRSKDYDIGDQSNFAYLQRDGVLVVRLAAGELLLLPDPADPEIDIITPNLQDASYACYPVRRQDSHFWYFLLGQCAPLLFAKLCSVDVSPEAYPNNSVAQTSIARASSIIVRHDTADFLSYYLLGDNSMSRYMWNTIIDALNEFDGRVLSVHALQTRHGALRNHSLIG